MSSQNEVKKAAANIVAAFGSHNVDAYFAGFASEATFLFHSSHQLFGSRAEYQSEWALWEEDGFHVLDCQSSDARVDLISTDVAVFTHTVRTRLADGAGTIETGERETIIFQLHDGQWLGIHEHLSVDPNFVQ